VGRWFNAHSHSNFSPLDGMASVPEIVAKAAFMGHQAVALTDHGQMAGTTQLYIEAKKHGLKAFPGCELYMLDPEDPETDMTKMGSAKRYHFGMLALNETGYNAMVKLVSLSHTRPRFSKFPRLTLDDVLEMGAEFGDNVAVTTGCYFGFAQQLINNGSNRRATSYIEQLAITFTHTFVELQHHNITHDQDGEDDPFTDDDMVSSLVEIADQLGLPVLATQDSHYLLQRDKKAHSLMKQMVYGGADDAFPGDSFHFASEEWVAEHYQPKVWEKALQGCDELLALHALTLPALDVYKPRVPTIAKDADKTLRTKVEGVLDAYLTEHGLQKRRKVYQDRIDYELGIIAQLGQADYILLCDIVAAWCEDNVVCIEVRGSANGSLVLRLLKVTSVDPIKDGVTFDRFLSTDRKKPPDVDFDIEDVRRGDLIDYLRQNFDIAQIGTFGALGSSLDKEGDEKGSVLVTYKAYLAKQVDVEYEEWRTAEWDKLDRKGRGKPRDAEWEKRNEEDKRLIYSKIQTMKDMKRYFPEDYPALNRISEMGSVYKSYGVHAGGVLLSGDDILIEDWIPTMLIGSSETIASMFTMDDVELWGLLKLDILGQRTLTIMRLCQELIGRKNPRDFSWIPRDDPKAMALLREGRTDTGIFHAEGYALANSEPVLTAVGWVPIGELQPDDLVIDPDGGEAVVEAVYPQGVKDTYEVTTTDGVSIRATADHLWNVYVEGKAYTLSTNDIAVVMKEGSVVDLRPLDGDFDFGDEELNTVPLPIDPYLLGTILAGADFWQGQQKKMLRFKHRDMERIQPFLDEYPTATHTLERRGERSYVTFSNQGRQFARDLKKTGLDWTPGAQMFVPDEYLWRPREDRLALLQGLMDSGGHMEIMMGQKISFTHRSSAVVNSVVFLIRSLGGSCSETEPTKIYTPAGYRDGYTTDEIYMPVSPYRRATKNALWDRSFDPNRYWGNTIASIKHYGQEDAVCIRVSSSSSCFVTRGFKVTHNTKSKGFKEMQVRTTKDIILGTALYMPGAMNTGQTDLYIKRRRDPELRTQIDYPHEIFESELGKTYGTVVYQEQVLAIMRRLGMEMSTINTLFKIVKDSGKGAEARNRVRIKPIREEFDTLCEKNNVTGSYDDAWDWLTGIVAYAFNQAHATGYGIRTYRCAYLKAHYQLEFMSALLEGNAGNKKEPVYLKEANRLEIPILAPSVNRSGPSWTMDARLQAIRKGLVSIPGVGVEASRTIAAGAPYKSVEDLCQRAVHRTVTGRKPFLESGTYAGTIAALKGAGALKIPERS
jgi:DNA polymerase III alpha subunit